MQATVRARLGLCALRHVAHGRERAEQHSRGQSTVGRLQPGLKEAAAAAAANNTTATAKAAGVTGGPSSSDLRLPRHPRILNKSVTGIEICNGVKYAVGVSARFDAKPTVLVQGDPDTFSSSPFACKLSASF